MKHVIALSAIVAASAGIAPVVHAQEAVDTRTTGPNRALLHSGVGVLVLSYVPAVVVAATNSRPSDNNLYIPVAGPWMDLSDRGDCRSCNHESLYKTLLVTDGIFQGLGALEIVGSFLFPETTTVHEHVAHREDLRPRVSFQPAMMGGGAGFLATGRF